MALYYERLNRFGWCPPTLQGLSLGAIHVTSTLSRSAETALLGRGSASVFINVVHGRCTSHFPVSILMFLARIWVYGKKIF